MIVYKWVIKKKDKYYPIVNNGAYPPFNNLNLGYYKKGKTIKGFINPYQLIKNGNRFKQKKFHRIGFHFWTSPKGQRFESYQKCIQRSQKEINAILKCYIRQRDIILKDQNRVIAKKFRVLQEIKISNVKKTKGSSVA